MKPLVDIIIPSFNNTGFLHKCIYSINHYTRTPHRITVVNNGDEKTYFDDNCPHIALDPGKNLMWTDAINYAADHLIRGLADIAPYILMLNDDTQILDHDGGWLDRLLKPFDSEVKVGATGPVSNYAMGYQSIGNSYGFSPEFSRFVSPALSGFCMLTPSEVFRGLGGLDPDFQHGSEDVDYCLRMRQAGYECVVCRDVFVYHVGSQTADKVFPAGWWNSNQYSVEERMKLLRKFGVRTYYQMTHHMTNEYLSEDRGREKIKEYIGEDADVLDFGCGPEKIVPWAVGVDLPNAEEYFRYRPIYAGRPSAADHRVELNGTLPFGSKSFDYVVMAHVLEHIVDPIPVLNEAYRVLRENGELIITMPAQELCDAIRLDPTHVHAYSCRSLRNLLEVTYFEVCECYIPTPGFNLFCVARRPM